MTPELTKAEIAIWRERTTNVARGRWRKVRAEGKEPQVIRLQGGPLDGVPNVLTPDAGSIIGWCYLTDRALAMAQYRYDGESDVWKFKELCWPGCEPEELPSDPR